MSVYNNSALPKRLLAQLFDEFDNPSSGPNIKVQLAKDPGIKVSYFFSNVILT